MNNQPAEKVPELHPPKYKIRYAFTQQLLQAWRPRPTLKCAITIYTTIGLIFFAFGIAIIVLTQQIYEFESRYDDKAKVSSTTKIQVPFNVDRELKAPIYLFYQIKGFYQNHRRYIKSMSLDQLRKGEYMAPGDLSDCDPVINNTQLWDYQQYAVDGGAKLPPDDAATPCGAAARAYFNDTFTLKSTNGTLIPISNQGIAWPDDIKYKFKNIDLKRQWINMEDERFINWMKISPFSNFRKTWGVINTNLPQGDYIMEILHIWDSSKFEGEKWFVLSETNAFGGKNEFLAYSYIAVGSLSILLALIFSLRKFKRPKGITEYQLKRAAPNAPVTVNANPPPPQ